MIGISSRTCLWCGRKDELGSWGCGCPVHGEDANALMIEVNRLLPVFGQDLRVDHRDDIKAAVLSGGKDDWRFFDAVPLL